MDVGIYSYSHGDSILIDKIVNEFLSQGKFDKLRKECMSDADTKPAYQNLQQRVESTVAQFLKKQVWRPDLNKNQLRDTLRKHILDSNFFDAGINRIVDQVVNPNVLATVFLPEVEEVVYNYLSIPKPTDKSQKKVPLSNDYEKLKPPGSENENVSYDDYEALNKSTKNNDCLQQTNGVKEKYKSKSLITENLSNDTNFEGVIENMKTLPLVEGKAKTKAENKSEIEENEVKVEYNNLSNVSKSQTKFEFPSDESQESLDRLGVEKLRISETEPSQSMDSDISAPLLEFNDKSMSESRDSEDSIMNQMSPISQGRLTPDFLEDEMKLEKEDKVEEKKALTFSERIPKIKQNDSEPSKSSKKEEYGKCEKLDAKSIYSSDESDSSKSYGRSDSDDKKPKDHRKKKEKKSYFKDEKKRKDDINKSKKEDDYRKNSKEKDKDKDRDKDKKNRDDKLKDSSVRDRERKRERSRDKSGDGSIDKSRDRNREAKKSSSARPSREKSISHKSSHHSHHTDSRSKDRSRDKKRKEEEKKKSKNADDHGKERNKKDDRRSTDRDNNEKDKGSDSRSLGETRRREGEHKTEDEKHQETQKKEAEVEEERELTPEAQEVVIEMDGDWVPEGEEIVLVNEAEWICSGTVLETKEQDINDEANFISEKHTIINPNWESSMDLHELIRLGALTKIKFSKVTDDFYAKFNSTGFRYFEDWERCKLDCEEEFKEFVDEAENNLDLISDEGSEPEVDFNFQEENLKTVKNLWRGLGNFKRSLTFDPESSEFYKWSNTKFYQKFRKKDENKKWRNAEKNESDESIKENIGRVYVASEDFDFQKEKNKENLAREKKALHLKLLNRLKRRAIRQGKQRRRYRRKALQEGIKEKNENSKALTKTMKGVCQPENGRLYAPGIKLVERIGETETSFLGANLPGKISSRKDILNEFEKSMVIEGELNSPNENVVSNSNQTVTDAFEIQTRNCLGAECFERVRNPDAQERKKLNGINLGENGENLKRTGEEAIFKGHHIRRVCNLNMDADDNDCNANRNLAGKEESSKHKRSMTLESNEDGIRERKQQKRNYCQKYDSQDLYKPRPILNSSRVRGRGRGNATAEADS